MKRGLGVEQKPRQITDNIHGTICLSWIESEMMSTSFFYRLHDIYQSSTVYLTFPSNRTKRYEHCLGTLKLAGQLFFSAVINASVQVRADFLKLLTDEFKKIIKGIQSREVATAFYGKDTAIQETMASCLTKEALKNFDQVKSHIASGMRESCIHDSALETQTVCFFDQLHNPNRSGEDVLFFVFLYQCTLQAIRIAAMFHDVGHPPFSHILEKTLNELYEECSQNRNNEFDEEKAATLVGRLKFFIGTHTQPSTILSSSGDLNSALHEQIGLKMLQLAIQSVIKSLFHDVEDVEKGKKKLSLQVTRSLYYITVVEFTFAILLEKSPVFFTLHRILDGPVDADRLDYVVRDTTNSGTQWGEIPYERIIQSAKLMRSEKGEFVLAFHEKVTDDLDDLLVTRYKIFSRINFHHRAVKTAHLLQKSVRLLAEDYLRTPLGEEESLDEDPICPEIAGLWEALGNGLGISEAEGKISNWNDSWLISILHDTYIKLSDSAFRTALQSDRPGRTEQDLLSLKDLLEVLLLNHTRYYTMLKRQRDAKRLMDGIRNEADLTDAKLNSQILHENEKLLNSFTVEEQKEAKDSLHRIQSLKTKVFPYGDFEELQMHLPFGYCEDIIKHILEKDTRVTDYIVVSNPVRRSLGITSDKKDHIYLYTSTSEEVPYEYDINITLKPLLKAQRHSCLWLHVYVKLQEGEVVGKVLNDLNRQVKEEIGARVKAVFSELLLSSKLE